MTNGPQGRLRLTAIALAALAICLTFPIGLLLGYSTQQISPFFFAIAIGLVIVSRLLNSLLTPKVIKAGTEGKSEFRTGLKYVATGTVAIIVGIKVGVLMGYPLELVGRVVGGIALATAFAAAISQQISRDRAKQRKLAEAAVGDVQNKDDLVQKQLRLKRSSNRRAGLLAMGTGIGIGLLYLAFTVADLEGTARVVEHGFVTNLSEYTNKNNFKNCSISLQSAIGDFTTSIGLGCSDAPPVGQHVDFTYQIGRITGQRVVRIPACIAPYDAAKCRSPLNQI